MSEMSALLHAAAYRMECGQEIFSGVSPAAYAYLLRMAAEGVTELGLNHGQPAWLQEQLFSLLDPVDA